MHETRLFSQDAFAALLEGVPEEQWTTGFARWATQLVSWLNGNPPGRKSQSLKEASRDEGADDEMTGLAAVAATPPLLRVGITRAALVQLCQWLPQSVRGIALQARISLAAIRLLIRRQQQTDDRDADAR